MRIERDAVGRVRGGRERERRRGNGASDKKHKILVKQHNILV
jgi:hypothetical protein